MNLFRLAAWASLFFISGASSASSDISLSGIFGDKAVIMLPDGSVVTLKKGGAARQGLRLLSVENTKTALVEANGQEIRLVLGAAPVRTNAAGADQTESGMIVVRPDARGHMMVDGAINDQYVRFLVDTGATNVAISASDAKRAGIDYRAGQQGMSQTANGAVAVWLVTLKKVRIGSGIVLYNVEGTVHENTLPVSLLGMSALKRIEMRPEGSHTVFRKRY